MSYKLIKEIAVNKKELIRKDEYSKISLEYDGKTFTGKPLLERKDNVALILEGDGMELAVLYQIDSFNVEKNCRVIIFEDDDWSLYNFIEKMKNRCYDNPNMKIKALKEFYKKLESDFKNFETEDTSSPSSPNTSIFRSPVSGKINFEDKGNSYDSYSGLTTNFVFSLKIGCGIIENQRILLEAVAKTATDITTHYIKNTNTFVGDGSNFNTIAVSIH